MILRIRLLSIIFVASLLYIQIEIHHKFIRKNLVERNLSREASGECYQKLVSFNGYTSRIDDLNNLLIIMAIPMFLIVKYSYTALMRYHTSKYSDTIINISSLLQLNFVIVTTGCFLQNGGWDLTKTMIAMLLKPDLCDGFKNGSTNKIFLSFELFLAEITLSVIVCITSQFVTFLGVYERFDQSSQKNPEEGMRRESFTAVQTGLRVSLQVLSLCVILIYCSIVSIKYIHPKTDPHTPKIAGYICFAQENDDSMAGLMSAVWIVDFFLNFALIGLCCVLGFSENYQLHWPVSAISATRFAFVLIEVYHISSLTGDTALDIILSVGDGSCQIKTGQDTAFKVLVTVFILRCTKASVTLIMTIIAYLHSLVIFMFALEYQENESTDSNSDVELEVILSDK